jgi:hypothetical protein
MSELIVQLEHLHDALPKFRQAVDEVNKVSSTVNAALKGVEDIVGGVSQYTFEGGEYLVVEMADALDRAIRDIEEALAAPVGDPDDPWWNPLPDDPTPHNGETTNWSDGAHGHDDDDHEHDHEDNGGDPASSGAGMSPTTSTTGGGENVPPGDEQQAGNQGQPGQAGGNAGQGQSGNQAGQSGGNVQGGAAGGVVGAVMGALGLNKKKKDDEEAEEEETEEYVSATNAPVKKELDEKKALLEQTEARMTELEAERAEKADLLGRLQAAAAANPDGDSQLEERIAQLKKELTEMDSELYYGNEDIPRLREEIEALQKRLDIFQFGPDADWDAIRALEGGETSEWIRNATRNEDNSVNCVNYVVNRMPIPPELPFNAHLWDEQVMKYGPKYGITIGEVPLEGSVIVMEREHSYAHDIYGHVMYVEKVDENGVVWVTDNIYSDKMVRLDDLTSETSGPYIHYLYFPYQTKV